MLDTDTAVEVCKESKELECAMLLAQKAKNVDQKIRLLLDDFGKAEEALQTILDEVELHKQPQYLRRFGHQIVKIIPEKAYDAVETIAQRLIAARDAEPDNASKYIQQFRWLKEIFVDNKVLNKKFIDFQIKANDKCEPELYHSLIEWLLQDHAASETELEELLKEEKKAPANLSAETPEELKESAKPSANFAKRKGQLEKAISKKEDDLIQALKDYQDKYDKRHALMLVEMYDVPEAVGVLCKMLGLMNELITYYIKSKNYPKIIEVCVEFGSSDQNLWVQALSFFVAEQERLPDDSKISSYIMQILKYLEEVPIISPVMVLEIIGRNKALKYSIVKDYLLEKLRRIQTTIDKSQKAVKEYDESIQKTKQTISTLRTTAQVFHIRECSECGKKLELPMYHFTCNHSYHEYCITSEATVKECPKCCIQAQQVLDKKTQLLGQADNQEQFFKELRESDKKFDVVAQYFGRSLFEIVEAPKQNEDLEMKMDDFTIEDF
eukprot:TRINITY_DN2650_c0_g1_i13.p1 TRINITY_DN2650_c0_g1~~TRINITY_DN2650_c0_g1_i13.p1  ORF type:complete len:496 (-),score=159.96 TRINITY_DN2650_c0_g1_i13:144-1631(-)